MVRCNEQKLVFYFDMDGVLAKWRSVPEDETHVPGYFRELEVEPKVVCLIKRLIDAGHTVKILSCVYDGKAKWEKTEWLNANHLGGVDRVFVPYGERKELFVDPSCFNVLVDDYTANLKAWRDAGFLPFKFYNGINGRIHRWLGYSLDGINQTADEMFTVLISVATQLQKGVA